MVSTLTLSELTPVAAPSPPRRRAGAGHGKPADLEWLPESESGTSVSTASTGQPGPASKAGSIDAITSQRRWRIEKLVLSETPHAAASRSVAPASIASA